MIRVREAALINSDDERRKMKRTLVAIVLGATAMLAQASAWHVIASGDKESLEVDNATYKIAENVVTVWFKHSFKTQQLTDGLSFNQTLARVSIDCRNDTVVTSTIQFISGETTVFTTSYPKADIPPDSIAQVIEKGVCPRQ
jgi:hypothetical protein